MTKPGQVLISYEHSVHFLASSREAWNVRRSCMSIVHLQSLMQADKPQTVLLPRNNEQADTTKLSTTGGTELSISILAFLKRGLMLFLIGVVSILPK